MYAFSMPEQDLEEFHHQHNILEQDYGQPQQQQQQQQAHWFEDYSPAESERTTPSLDAAVDYNHEDSTATSSRAFVLTVSTGFVAKNNNNTNCLSQGNTKPCSNDESGLFTRVMKSTSRTMRMIRARKRVQRKNKDIFLQ
jgi:hypothetical protein